MEEIHSSIDVNETRKRTVDFYASQAGFQRQSSHASGLDIIVAKFESEIDEWRTRAWAAEDKLAAFEKNRKYVLGVLNFIKSTAFGIKTPDAEPDFQKEIDEKFSGGFQHTNPTPHDVVGDTISSNEEDHLN